MNFDDFLKNLANPEKTRNFNIFKNYNLENFESCIRNLGLHRKFSEKKFPIRISVVGTNGKGSVSHILSELAKISGLFKKIGLYTSPHLLHKEERIRLNGQKILANKLNSLFVGLFRSYKQILNDLSYFELFTVMAFYYFEMENCDLEIYEAGLGGRLDATRMAFSDILVLTKIGLDHPEILGKTKEAILMEKLAISSEFTKDLFYYDQEDAKLNDMISDYCKNNKIRVSLFPERFEDSDYLSYNQRYCKFILKSVNPEFDSAITHVGDLNMPGRMEIFRVNPVIVFDVAHNVPAVEYLLKSLKNKFPSFNVLFSCLKDKDVQGMLNALSCEVKVEKIYYYISSEFSELNFVNDKIIVIEKSGLTPLFENNIKPLVIAGSFRLYAIVKEILDNAKK